MACCCCALMLRCTLQTSTRCAHLVCSCSGFQAGHRCYCVDTLVWVHVPQIGMVFKV